MAREELIKERYPDKARKRGSIEEGKSTKEVERMLEAS
jgi:hypothetical protein